MQEGSVRMVVVAIPAYNEEKSIGKVIVQAKKQADAVIVCDDGSTDSTWRIAASLGADVVRHERNLGYGAAIASLFRRAREMNAEVMVTLDGDGQHDPAVIRTLTKPIEEGAADIVIGSRFSEEGSSQMPEYRRAGAKAITKLLEVMSHSGITDAQSGYRAYGRKALETVEPTEMGMGASTEILSRANGAGLKILEVPIEVSYDGDSSTHNPLVHGLDVLLTTFKTWSIRHPLVVYGVPGMASLLVAVGFWWWTLSLFAETHTVVTNVTLIAVASTIVGLILMAIAVILWVMISVVRER
ncbi:MAG: glycosyltransferase family 2 protein [Nitrososphaerales archaeon]